MYKYVIACRREAELKVFTGPDNLRDLRQFASIVVGVYNMDILIRVSAQITLFILHRETDDTFAQYYARKYGFFSSVSPPSVKSLLFINQSCLKASCRKTCANLQLGFDPCWFCYACPTSYSCHFVNNLLWQKIGTAYRFS